MKSKKIFITIPTYNERDNIARIIKEILSLKIPNLHILVADDNSPDGTWKVVKGISDRNSNVHLLLRDGPRGRGLAGVEAFKKALSRGADIIIEMDADFSHDPKYIPILLYKLESCDLVIGSRLVNGGKDVGRGVVRRTITKLANLYIRAVFGMKIKDCTSGYRCFKREVLESIDLDKLKSTGPSIVQEVLYLAYRGGFRICEVPIIFQNRTVGETKLSVKTLLNSYFFILKLRLSMMRN